MSLTTPDKRFGLRLFSDDKLTAFIATPSKPAHTARWERVPGAQIILVGEVDEQLRLLIDNYTTKELVELLSLSPHALHLLRVHLRMPTGPTGQHGGARPNAGRPIQAEHVIGLTPVELARGDADAARRRYEEVTAAGMLRPRGDARRGLDDSGSTFDYDLLAGDGRYVFLSRGKRYRVIREPKLAYGFVFDATRLVEGGAFVGPDLLGDYEELADEIANQLAAQSPGQPATDEEMAEFAALLGGDDPALLAAVREMSASRYWDILSALQEGDDSTPEAAEALRLYREGAARIQAEKRVAGDAALKLLRGPGRHRRLEILWPGELPLEWAIARIEAGEIIK